MGKKFSDYTNKEDAELGLDWKPGQESVIEKEPEKLTIWKKSILILMLIKILFTAIALLWGFGNSIRYLEKLKNNYYPLVFYSSADPLSNSTGTSTSQHILITNNISNFTASTNTLGNQTLYYNRDTMENCRIYSAGQRAVFITLQNDTFTTVESAQFTETPKSYNNVFFFEFEFVVDGILIVISVLLYVWVLVKDIIGLIRQNKKYKGLDTVTRGDMYPDDTNSFRKRLGRVYHTIRDCLVLLIIDLGFVDIYNTELNTCVTNVPPAKDVIARFVSQSNLVTSETPDYNLHYGNFHIWMNIFAFTIIAYLCCKFIQLVCFTIAKCCYKEPGSGDRLRSIIRGIVEVLVLTIISFLAVIMLIWRFNYLDWSKAGAAFSVSGKEIAKILLSILTCCNW